MRPSILCASLVGGVVCAAAAPPSVETKQGTLLGGTCESEAINYFSSIPYAKAPVGQLRYAAPRPYGSFGCRDATVTAPACPQFGSIFLETGPQSEDWFVLSRLPARARKVVALLMSY